MIGSLIDLNNGFFPALNLMIYFLHPNGILLKVFYFYFDFYIDFGLDFESEIKNCFFVLQCFELVSC